MYFLAEESGHEKLYSAPIAAAGKSGASSTVTPAFDMARGVYSNLAIAQGSGAVRSGGARRTSPVIVALYESATAFRDLFATHVVIDDDQRFVTGPNQNSGAETAHEMMRLIAERPQP